jgi:hypothetical protein
VNQCEGGDRTPTASFSGVAAFGGDSEGPGGISGARSSSVGVMHNDVDCDKCGERVGDVGPGEGGHDGVDGVAEGGREGEQETGESTISPSHPPSRSNSMSHCRLTAFLVGFAGGGEALGDVTSVGGSSGATGGDNCLGGVGGDTERIGIASQCVAASAGGGTSEHGTSVAASKRRWRR